MVYITLKSGRMYQKMKHFRKTHHPVALLLMTEHSHIFKALLNLGKFYFSLSLSIILSILLSYLKT